MLVDFTKKLTLPIHVLLYDTILKDKEWMRYETTYNTILMLLRTILTLQYDCLQIDKIMINCLQSWPNYISEGNPDLKLTESELRSLFT